MIRQPHRIETDPLGGARVLGDGLELQRVLAGVPNSRTAGGRGRASSGPRLASRSLLAVLECVANVSEGRDRSVLATLTNACAGRAARRARGRGSQPQRVHARGPRPRRRGRRRDRTRGRASPSRVSLVGHAGVHPRLGALDVVPFVALEGGDAAGPRPPSTARAFGIWWAETFAVPVFFYDDADDAAPRPSLRAPRCVPRAQSRLRAAGAAPSAGCDGGRRTAAARRDQLRARDGDVGIARAIATRVRGRDGGLPGVRALGFRAGGGRARAQVSMNLVDLERTGIEAACTAVREAAERGRHRGQPRRARRPRPRGASSNAAAARSSPGAA